MSRRCRRAPKPDEHSRTLDDQHRQRPDRDVPDRGRRARASPARPSRRSSSSWAGRLLRAAGDGRARSVDGLRHDRPHQLRPRRADHVRCAGRLLHRSAARQDRDRRHRGHGHRRGDGCVPGRRRVRLGERQGALASAPPPWHRAGGDDDREHRPVDLPPQHLPVLRRRAGPELLAVRRRRAVGDRPDPAHTQGAGRDPRGITVLVVTTSLLQFTRLGRPPARSPTTRGLPLPPASTSSG